MKNEPQEYFLISHNGTNLGDAAIAASTIQHIRSVNKDAGITLESSFPENSSKYFKDINIVGRFFDISKLKIDEKTSGIPFLLNNLSTLVMTIIRIVWLFTSSRLGVRALMPQFLKRAADATKVLSIAGDSISERYAFYLRFIEIDAISKVNKEIIIYSQSIGPFSSNWSKKWAAKSLSRVKVILARDQRTIELLEEYGVDTTIERTADTAISLIPKSTKRVKKYIKDNKLSNTTVAIVMRTKTLSKLSDKEYSNYQDKIIDLINELSKNKITAIFTGSIREDIAAAEELCEERKLDVDIVPLYEFTPSEAKTILSTVGALISPRMHPVILATSVGTPAIGIVQEFKLSSFLNDIEQNNSHFPVLDFKPKKVANLATEYVSNRSKISKSVNAGVKKLHKLSLHNSDYL